MAKAAKVNAKGRNVSNKFSAKPQVVESAETTEAVEKKRGRQAVVVSDQMKKRLEELGEANISVKIRTLRAEGFSRSEVAKGLGKLYQHVRNVEVTPLKKG